MPTAILPGWISCQAKGSDVCSSKAGDSSHRSYALVAQAHCLCLLRRGDTDLRFRDVPYFYPTWKTTRGLVAPEDERVLTALRPPGAEFLPEATFSMRAEESDFTAARSGRKFVFGTPEYRVLGERQRGGLSSGAELPDTLDIVTPSHWCVPACERFGIPPSRIHVVPHGIDPEVLHADAAARANARAALHIEDHQQVFLSVGAMTPNKGIDLLLAAFARLAAAEPDVRLVLKGADGLYPSRDFVRAALDPEHLYELMAAAARDRETWRGMGERGAEHVHRHFSWSAVTDRLVSCLFDGA
jgi:glycosyltransferase involved in cell wall biosynthesis